MDTDIPHAIGQVRVLSPVVTICAGLTATAYERNSVIVTTNLPFENWTEVLGNERHELAVLEAERVEYRLSAIISLVLASTPPGGTHARQFLAESDSRNRRH